MSRNGRSTCRGTGWILLIWTLDEWFFLDAMTVPAKENRYMAIGRLNDGTIAVVFALLGTEGVSVISMRPASRKERSLL
jgi:uncharacterized DUF497 family protein